MLWKQLWNCWCTDLVGRYLFWESRFEADVYISQSTLVSDWAKTVSEEKIEDTISWYGSFPCLGSFSCHRIFCTQAISKLCWANFNFNIQLDSILSPLGFWNAERDIMCGYKECAAHSGRWCWTSAGPPRRSLGLTHIHLHSLASFETTLIASL